MIDTAVIQNHLEFWDQVYNDHDQVSSKNKLKSGSPIALSLISKAAVTELHGWVEQVLEDICTLYAEKHIKNKTHQNMVKEQVQNNNGISYQNHFSKLFCCTVGEKEWLSWINEQDWQERLETQLNTLRQHRNDLVHTFISQERLGNIPQPKKLINEFLLPLAEFLEQIRKHFLK